MRRLVALAAALLLAGCAGSQKFGDHPEIAGKPTGAVRIARSMSAQGSAITAPIHVDRYRVGLLGPGGSISVIVPAGRRLISSTMGDVPFEIRPGATAYFEVSPPGLMWLREPDFEVQPINAERWRQLVGGDR